MLKIISVLGYQRISEHNLILCIYLFVILNKFSRLSSPITKNVMFLRPRGLHVIPSTSEAIIMIESQKLITTNRLYDFFLLL